MKHSLGGATRYRHPYEWCVITFVTAFSAEAVSLMAEGINISSNNATGIDLFCEIITYCKAQSAQGFITRVKHLNRAKYEFN